MKLLSTIIMMLVVFTFYHQNSSGYDKIKKELKPIAVYDTVAKFKNGNLKFKGSIVEFDTEKYVYYRNVGKFERFYKSGSLMRISNFDSYGLLLNEKFYDPSGGLFCEFELTDFDTNAKSVAEFLESDKHMTYLTKEKNYKYSIRWGVAYLSSEGRRKNGKKIGVWKFYDVHGNLKKEKEY